MKSIKTFFFAAAVFAALQSSAQKSDKDYKERAEETRNEIWNQPEAAFKVTDVPANYSNESAVIIARNFNVVNSAKLKLKMTIFGMGAAQRISYQTTIHERVKLNDKAALDDYSTLEYTKRLNNTVHVGFTRVLNTTSTYVGAKIIKPSGEEVIVNTNEEVLLKNENDAKEGKLAIPNLQAGDILDYYIRAETMQETGSEVQGPYTFVMGGEYPIMYYNAKLRLDDRVGVEYVSANGAPSFREDKSDDGDILLELTQKNLPRLESAWWTSIPRQYPYIVLQYMFVTKQMDAYSHFNRGEVKHGFLSDDLVTQLTNALKNPAGIADFTPQINTTAYFGGSKKIKDYPQDTIVKVLYNYWRFRTFCTFTEKDINITNDNNYAAANSLVGAISMSRMLTALDIDNEIYLVCSRNGSSLKNVMSIGDFSAMVRAYPDNKKYWLAFDDIVTQFNEIPVRFQGEDAITIHPEREKKTVNYNTGRGKVPVSKSSDNSITENINVNFDETNMQLLKIDRSCLQTGFMRHADQKHLLLLQDVDEQLSASLNEKNVLDRFAADKKQQKLGNEYATVFNKERAKTKDYFTAELKDQFGAEPKEVSAYSIKDACLFNEQHPFEYQTTFSLENIVKKAGNNFIVEVGKLVGTFDKPDEKDRTRNIDVYMPCARSFTYIISINIPKGYNVKGVSDLNKQVTNATGTFSCEASADAASVKIKVTRVYNNNFEKAADWSRLLELIDGFYNFTTQKLLIEKAK